MTMRLACLCCRETLSTSPVRRADAFEHDHSIRILGSALARRGTEHQFHPPRADIDAARRVLAAVPFDTTPAST